MNLTPLALLAVSLLLAFLLVYASEAILWRLLYNPRLYYEAVATLEELSEKLREARRRGDRRLERRVRLLEARVQHHRSLIVRVSLTRGILYTFAYIVNGALTSLLFPVAFPAPAPIPIVTFAYRGGAWFAAPQVSLLATIVAIMALMGPGRLRTDADPARRRGVTGSAEARSTH